MMNFSTYISIFEYLMTCNRRSSWQSDEEYLKQLEKEKESLGELQRILKERLDTLHECEMNLRCPKGLGAIGKIRQPSMGKLYFMPHVRNHDQDQVQ